MANSIALFQKYIALLDEVYKLSSLSGDLDGDSTLVRQGANTNEIIIPKLSMDGLADYSRNGGYVRGDVSLEFETVKFNYDRGRQFVVDAMDDEETAGLAFGRLASEFLRTRVVPELDAFRFATYAGVDGISGAQGTLTDGESVLAALLDAVNRMDEDEVPQEQRLLYITPTLHNLIYAIDSYKSKEVLAGFSKTVKVPQTRFYTAIDLKNGTSAGETAGGFMKSPLRYEKCQASDEGALKVVEDSATPAAGEIKLSEVTPVADPTYTLAAGDYVKAAAGKEINFMIIHKPAILQYQKHVVSRPFTPSEQWVSDGWIYNYRAYGLADVYENKLAGIYCHSKA